MVRPISPQNVKRILDLLNSSVYVRVDLVSDVPRGAEERPGRELVREIQQFRGRVFYEGGRRPHFLTDHGAADEQALDWSAYHVQIRDRASHELVAVARLAPGASVGPGGVERELGGSAARVLADTLGRLPAEVMEAGRIAVDPAFQGFGLGPLVFMALGALATILENPYWGTSGTSAGQHRMYERLGAAIHPASSAAAPQYDDVFVLLVFDPAAIPVSLAQGYRALEHLMRPVVSALGKAGL
jgi:GNAT superfamily N-acetyltransferase